MKLHRVVGSVTLNRCHPSYRGAQLRAIEPLEPSQLWGEHESHQAGEPPELLVAWDDLGAGLGSTVAVSDGGEAAQPFRPDLKAVDAYCAAILDTVSIDRQAMKQLKT
jgi:microcompartment protein CcmK/EutM